MARPHARLLLAAACLLVVCPAAFAAGGQNPADVAIQVSRIPFSDWLAAQGTTIIVFQASNGSQPFSPPGNIGVVDYAGKNAAANGLSYGFAANGSVTLRSFPDGTGEVNVNLDFSNAVTYVNDVNKVRIFGYRSIELAQGGGPAALSNGHLQARYTVSDASHPELDLVGAFFNGGGTGVQLKFHSAGRGPCRAGLGVPDGTPGECVISQTGVFDTGGGGATGDGWPVEHVDVHPSGHAASTTSWTGSSGAGSTPEATAPSVQNTTSWGRLKALYR